MKLLHISVTDKNGGENQVLELNLRDYAESGEEYARYIRYSPSLLSLKSG